MPRLLLLLALVAALCGPGLAAAEPVALTFDDLPTLSLNEDPAYARITTRRLVDGLRRNRLPAIGFVVGAKFEAHPADRDAMLRQWLRGGLALGNHTYSHESLNRTPLAPYLVDIAHDDALLRSLSPRKPPRWFRHPYLEAGATAEQTQGVAAWLDAHGYRVAPVTLENADDVFALPYDEAVSQGNQAKAAEIRRTYLAFTDRSIAWYRQAALELLGRRPALVFLLHASRLNADSIDDLARLVRSQQLRPVSLDEAMRDPAYRLPDGPPDADGDDWLNRWAGVLHRDLPWDSFPETPADIAAESQRLDAEP